MRSRHKTAAAFLFAVLCGLSFLDRAVVAQGPFTSQIESFWQAIRNGGRAFTILATSVNGYHNFSTPLGTTGYGIRDNAGTMEVKNSGGSWAAILYSGGSFSFTNVPVTEQFFGPVAAASCAATPPYSFTGDTNTGMGSSAADVLCWVTGGTSRLTLSSTALTSTLPILHPDGTAAAPSLTFASEPSTGWYQAGAGDTRFSSQGTDRLRINTSDFVLAATQFLAWGSSGVTSRDTILTREAANHFAQRNSTTAQRASWMNTYTSATNYEAFSVDWQTTANIALVGTRTAATGTGRRVGLVSQGSSATNAYAGVFADRTTGLSLSGSYTTFSALGIFDSGGATSSTSLTTAMFSATGYGTSTATSGTIVGNAVLPTYNQASGNAANTDLLINRTETAIGSGAQLLIDAQVGSSSKFKVDRTGAITALGTTTLATGLTGILRADAGVVSVDAASSTEVIGVAAGYKVARGSTALDASNPTTTATGLSTVVACAGTLLRTTAVSTGTAFLTHAAASGANVDWYAWVIAGTASTGTEVFEWVCVGT